MKIFFITSGPGFIYAEAKYSGMLTLKLQLFQSGPSQYVLLLVSLVTE